MVDKILSVVTKIFAVAIVIITVILFSLLYKNKYMLVSGQEQTLQGSIYSSKDLEIAIQDLNTQAGEMQLIVRNKGNKAINIRLDTVKLNNTSLNARFNQTVQPDEVVQSLVDLKETIEAENLQDVNSMEVKFKVNNVHDIDMTLSISKEKANAEEKTNSEEETSIEEEANGEEDGTTSQASLR